MDFLGFIVYLLSWLLIISPVVFLINLLINRKNEKYRSGRPAYIVSIIGLILILIGFILSIIFSYYTFINPPHVDFEAGFIGMIFLFFYTVCLYLSGFLAIFTYKNPSEHFKFQKSRLKIALAALFLGIIIIVGCSFYGFYRYNKEVRETKIRTGVIGGIAQEQAIVAAEKQINVGTKHSLDFARLEEGYSQDFAAWDVSFTMFDKQSRPVISRDFYINAKNGELVLLSGEYSTTFKITKDGQPLQNSQVLLETRWSGEGQLDFGITDLGVTDINGNIKFILDKDKLTKAYFSDENKFYDFDKSNPNNSGLTEYKIEVNDLGSY